MIARVGDVAVVVLHSGDRPRPPVRPSRFGRHRVCLTFVELDRRSHRGQAGRPIMLARSWDYNLEFSDPVVSRVLTCTGAIFTQLPYRIY